MVKSVEGIYRNGKVELVGPLTEAEGSRVIVTWVDPAERVIAPFAEDWDWPEMAAYDELPPR